MGDGLHFLTLLNPGGLLFINSPALRGWTLLYYWLWKFRAPLHTCLLTHTRVQTEINLQISVLLQNATDARWNSTLGQCDVLKSPYMLLLH